MIHMMFFELLLYVLALLSPKKGPRSLRDHPDIYQTPTDTLQTPRNSPSFLVKKWAKVIREVAKVDKDMIRSRFQGQI